MLANILLPDEDLGIVSLFMLNKHLILLDELLEVFEVQFLLLDACTQFVILLGRRCPCPDGFHPRLEVHSELRRQLTRCLNFLRPNVLLRSRLLPDGLFLFFLFFLALVSVRTVFLIELLVELLAVGVHLADTLQKMGRRSHFQKLSAIIDLKNYKTFIKLITYNLLKIKIKI